MSEQNKISRNNRYRYVFGYIFLSFAVMFLITSAFPLILTSGINQNEVKKDQGYCYYVERINGIPLRMFFNVDGDVLGANDKSEALLYENSKAIGPAHEYHNQIRQKGMGRYSFWGNTLLFSTSDNSSPTDNGKVYKIKQPLKPRCLLIVALFVSALLLLNRFSFTKAEQIAVITAVKISFIIILVQIVLGIILYVNLINPFIVFGKLVYFVLFLVIIILITITGFVFREISRCKSDINKRLSVTIRSVRNFLILISFVLAVESLAREFPVKDTLAVNPAVKYTWPDWINYKRNKKGFLDREFSEAKKPNMVRIIAVGDSYTAGAGIQRADTFSRLLERELNLISSDSILSNRFEVFNMGECGANTEEETQVIQLNGPIYKPEIVILAYVLNDAETHPLTIKYRNTPKWCEKIHDFFITTLRSYAYYKGFSKFTFFKIKNMDYKNTLVLQHQDDSEGWRKVKASIVNLHSMERQLNCHAIVVIFPLFIADNSYRANYGLIHDKVLAAFVGEGIEAYDLLPYYMSKNPDLSVFAISKEDAHPNQYAHKLAAEFLQTAVTNYLAGLHK